MFTLILDPDTGPAKDSGDVFLLGGSTLEQAASAALRIRAFVELIELHWGSDLGVPDWLLSGTASHATDLYRLELGEASAEELRSDRRAEVREHPTPSLGELEDAGLHGSTGLAAHALSALAVEWLERHAALIAGRPPASSEPAFVEFYRLLGASGDWQQSFVEAFGLAVGDFYVAFAAERGTPAGHPAHEFDDRHAPLLVLLGEVPTDVEAAVRADMQAVQSFFAEHFGAEPADYTVYVAADWTSARDAYVQLTRDTDVPGVCAYLSIADVAFLTLPCREELRSHLGWFHFRNVQEGIHPRANPYPPDPDGVHPQGADWLYAGTQYFAQYAYLRSQDPEAARELRDRHARVAARSGVPLAGMESIHVLSWGPSRHASRGFFAVEWLVEQVGAPALLHYYRLLDSSRDWKHAFRRAFGVSVEAFYPAAEAHIAGIVTLIPHLADDRAEPILVLLGDISPEEAAEAREDFEFAQTFFRERLGAPEADYTVYVAADDASATEPFRKAFGRDPDPGFCFTASQGSALVMTLDCGRPLSVYLGRYHYLNVNGVIGDETGHPRTGPLWLRDAIEGYARFAYEMAVRPDAAAQRRLALARIASQVTLPLSGLATYDPATTPEPQILQPLGYFIGELLVDHAGERALLDYLRQRSRTELWHVTFERVFEISVEDFYEEFEAYRVDFAHPGE
ncbi:MAG: hypothetical protein F4X80_05210 [Chloroflexi bacterium]|nr:hypothetical protein [Chloroflexota bacterium]